jgi:glycosyltransferase involved in cell wall biosynthesis
MSPAQGVQPGLRIAHLIETDGPGGAERVVAHLATTLQQAGATNVVFLPADGEGWLARQLARSGVVIEEFRLDRPLSPACAAWLEAAFRRHRVSVAHSHEFTMAVYGAWASWRAGIPHVITMHGSDYYAGRFRRRLALRTAMAFSRQTAAVSVALAHRLRRDLWMRPSRIAMIPNGVPCVPPPPATLREELGLRPDDRLLVSVGNLYPVKGHVHLVEAAASLIARHPTLHVAIAGRGGMQDALTALAASHGMSDRLHLLGLRADVAAILAAADVFVLPSLSEGLPLALLEAMFAGRPIVASDVGEVGTALEHGGAGVLVPPGSATALEAALDAVLSDPVRARALGEGAARRAAAEYDVSRMVGRYVGAYTEAINGRGGRATPAPAAELP